MKKSIILTLALTLLLAACGGGQKDGEFTLPGFLVDLLVDSNGYTNVEEFMEDMESDGDIQEAKLNKDNSITAKLDPDDHLLLRKELRDEFFSSSYVEAEDNYTKITIESDEMYYEREEILEYAFYTIFYHAMAGENVKKLKATIQAVDEETGEVLDEIKFPKEMKEVVEEIEDFMYY